jgi:tetratricopeptide (TPR) repeat protein
VRRLVIASAAVLLASFIASAGPAYGQAGRPVRAEAYLRYSVARLMEVQGMLADALVQYRLARSADPGQCGIGTAIARVQAGLDRPEEALATILEARALCPDSAEALSVHADILALMGDQAGAEAVLAAPARAESSSADLLASLCETLIAQGRADEAEALYRERCESDSLSPVLAFMHARVLMVCGRPDEAIDELLRAERLDPENRGVAAALGELLVSAGRTEEGARRLERVVARSGATDDEYASLAQTYCDLGIPERAVALLSARLAERGDTPQLLAALGAAQFRAGALADALSTNERLLTIDPNAVVALNYVAYTLAEEGRDLERAAEYAERAAGMAPSEADVRDTLGWVYFRLGRFDDARRELETAAALGVPSAVIHEHLGDALMALGLSEDARRAWRRALEIEPGRPSSIERLESAGAPEAQTP